MSQETQEWFVAERARALAMVYLTRRDDLAVVKAGQGIGLEFIVYIRKEDGETSVRQFGVFLRGTKGPVTEAHLDKLLSPRMNTLPKQFPYPVCLFHFTMDDDQGYYTWVAEPAVEDGKPRLVLHNTPHTKKLDSPALDKIVESVDRWYDAFFAQVAVKAS